MDTPTTDKQTTDLKPQAVTRDTRGRWIVPPKPSKPFTVENAREMQMKGIVRKRQVMAQAANSEVQDTRLIEKYGPYAHVAERAVTLQRIATTPEAGKAAVMAHAALTRDTGMDEPKVQAGMNVQAPSNQDDVLVMVMRRRLLVDDVIDADAVDAEPADLPHTEHDGVGADV